MPLLLVLSVLLLAAPPARGASSHPRASMGASGSADENSAPVVSFGPNLSRELRGAARPSRVFIGDLDSTRARDLSAYFTSGAAAKDRANAVRATAEYLDAWAVANCAEGISRCHAAVVVDIDDTLLDTSDFYQRTSPPFTADPRGWPRFRDGCRQRVIQPTRSLLATLHQQGWHVVILTARPNENRAATISCLQQGGIVGYDQLLMRRASDQVDSAGRVKEVARQSLEQRGWRVVASLGDQLSDMSGRALIQGFLMPNPMYAVW